MRLGRVVLLGVFLGSSVAAEAQLPLTATWNANPEPNIQKYQLLIGTSPGVYGPPIEVNAPATSVPLPALTCCQRYYLVIKAFNTIGLESPLTAEIFVDVGTPFTDTPLDVGVTPVKALHVNELRARIDALRLTVGLAAFPWVETVSNLVPTVIKTSHVSEMRTALGQAFTAASLMPPTYTDAVLVQLATLIKAVHFAELRTALIDIETP